MSDIINKTEQKAVFDIIVDVLGIEQSRVTLDARIEDLAEDSIQLFSLILAFEKQYHTEVDYDDLIEIDTVGDIVRYLDKNISMAGVPLTH
jgi:acyl carrier protein